MSCTNTPPELEAYVDGELNAEHDALLIASIATHVAGCAECRQHVANTRALGEALRTALPSYDASDSLRARVQSMVGNVAPISTALPTPVPRRASNSNWKTLALAASVLLAIVATHDIAIVRATAVVPRSETEDLVQAHIRSLLSDHLVDVPSSDRHTVKPWFEGKIEFALPVFDFAADSFPLAGGRLDFTSGHKTAAIVFHHGQHAINLFVWPVDDVDSTNTAIESVLVRGYSIATWRRNHLRYAAVSTVNMAALSQFARLYVARDSLTSASPTTP